MQGASGSNDDPANSGWYALLALLPRSVRSRVEPILRNPWLLALILGVPTVIGTVVGALILRRLFGRYVGRLRARRESRVLSTRRGPPSAIAISNDPAALASISGASHGVTKMASPAGIGGAIAPLSPLDSTFASAIGTRAGAGVGRNSASDLVVHDLKLRMARQREGWVRWVRGLVGWWLAKLYGVWEMGTTITYI